MSDEGWIRYKSEHVLGYTVDNLRRTHEIPHRRPPPGAARRGGRVNNETTGSSPPERVTIRERRPWTAERVAALLLTPLLVAVWPVVLVIGGFVMWVEDAGASGFRKVATFPLACIHLARTLDHTLDTTDTEV